MNFTKTQMAIIGIGLFIILVIIGLIFIPTGNPDEPTTQTTLNFWGVDDISAFAQTITSYQSEHPKITIKYTQIDPQNYETKLINALAVGQGPDILMFHRSWLDKNGDKVAPADPQKISYSKIKTLFPESVENDFTYKNNIYALPLYIDNLALYYNRDIFNTKAVANPPKNWADFKSISNYLTEFDLNHQIKISGTAMGGNTKSIASADDIVSVLMLQYGSSFAKSQTIGQNTNLYFDEKAGKAFDYYLQFANPSNSNYSWNSDSNSIDSFASGNTAMIVDYSNKINQIKQKNPYLNFSIAPLPQYDPYKPVNIADYWGLAVSRQSKYSNFSWNFIIKLTTDVNYSKTYLTATNRIPALRSALPNYYNDPDLGSFAQQTLVSVSIYQKDKDIYTKAISTAIDYALSGKQQPLQALNQAASIINSQ